MSEQNQSDNAEIFSTVIKHLKGYRFYLIAGGVCIVSANLLILLLPYITKIVFDLLEHGGSERELRNWVRGLLLIPIRMNLSS